MFASELCLDGVLLADHSEEDGPSVVSPDGILMDLLLRTNDCVEHRSSPTDVSEVPASHEGS